MEKSWKIYLYDDLIGKKRDEIFMVKELRNYAIFFKDTFLKNWYVSTLSQNSYKFWSHLQKTQWKNWNNFRTQRYQKYYKWYVTQLFRFRQFFQSIEVCKLEGPIKKIIQDLYPFLSKI